MLGRTLRLAKTCTRLARTSVTVHRSLTLYLLAATLRILGQYQFALSTILLAVYWVYSQDTGKVPVCSQYYITGSILGILSGYWGSTSMLSVLYYWQYWVYSQDAEAVPVCSQYYITGSILGILSGYWGSTSMLSVLYYLQHTGHTLRILGQYQYALSMLGQYQYALRFPVLAVSNHENTEYSPVLVASNLDCT